MNKPNTGTGFVKSGNSQQDLNGKHPCTLLCQYCIKATSGRNCVVELFNEVNVSLGYLT
jgi:hypothetical protein